MGRKRRFGLLTNSNKHTLENEAVNFPIQSIASDLTLLSAIAFNNWLKEEQEDDVKIVNIIHDAILVEVPESKLTFIAQTLSSFMRDTPKKYLGEVIPFKVSAEVSYGGWGDKKEFHL